MAVIPPGPSTIPYPQRDMYKMSGMGVIMILVGITMANTKNGTPPVIVGITIIAVGIVFLADAIYIFQHRSDE
jgi:hypothetical protein